MRPLIWAAILVVALPASADKKLPLEFRECIKPKNVNGQIRPKVDQECLILKLAEALDRLERRVYSIQVESQDLSKDRKAAYVADSCHTTCNKTYDDNEECTSSEDYVTEKTPLCSQDIINNRKSREQCHQRCRDLAPFPPTFGGGC